jgi:hypothetical protein
MLPVSLFMAMLMVVLSLPLQPVAAAMIDTETILENAQPQDARDKVLRFLARQDVRAALVAQGIDPAEAESRLHSLSNNEIQRLADNIDNLPAGGDAIGLVIGVLIIVLLVVIILRLV